MHVPAYLPILSQPRCGRGPSFFSLALRPGPRLHQVVTLPEQDALAGAATLHRRMIGDAVQTGSSPPASAGNEALVVETQGRGPVVLRLKSLGVAIFYLCASAGALLAQTAQPMQSPASPVAAAGGYQLTTQMIDQALR